MNRNDKKFFWRLALAIALIHMVTMLSIVVEMEVSGVVQGTWRENAVRFIATWLVFATLWIFEQYKKYR